MSDWRERWSVSVEESEPAPKRRPKRHDDEAKADESAGDDAEFVAPSPE